MLTAPGALVVCLGTSLVVIGDRSLWWPALAPLMSNRSVLVTVAVEGNRYTPNPPSGDGLSAAQFTSYALNCARLARVAASAQLWICVPRALWPGTSCRCLFWVRTYCQHVVGCSGTLSHTNQAGSQHHARPVPSPVPPPFCLA